MVRCKPGESTTQVLTIVNKTDQELLYYRDRRRGGPRRQAIVFAAGKIANGIASSAIATPTSVVVKPGESAAVHVTVTLPAETPQRAVVTFFEAALSPRFRALLR